MSSPACRTTTTGPSRKEGHRIGQIIAGTYGPGYRSVHPSPWSCVRSCEVNALRDHNNTCDITVSLHARTDILNIPSRSVAVAPRVASEDGASSGGSAESHRRARGGGIERDEFDGSVSGATRRQRNGGQHGSQTSERPLSGGCDIAGTAPLALPKTASRSARHGLNQFTADRAK